jgi:pyruvate,water dikinase
MLVELRAMIDAAGAEVTTLDDIRSVSLDAAALLDEYLRERGNMLATGYDITSLRLVEMPGLVVRSVVDARPITAVDHVALADSLRVAIAETDRTVFDERLADARSVMDMRDDNGPVTAEWPLGLLRRALLEVGARLVSNGRLVDPEHALEFTPTEARDPFGPTAPDAATMTARHDQRTAEALLEPPAMLGDAEPQPPLDVLPDVLAEMVAAVQVALQHLGMDAPASSATSATSDGLVGVGIGSTIYTGTARTAADADEALERLEPGDVLVVRATSPAFNAVLTIAGAIVTADGGALSHAAVLARELGIPAVVGAPGALSITDGATVEVDATRGSVRVLG